MAGLHEGLDPLLDRRLLEVVLAAHVHQLHLALDELQNQLGLPPRCPPLHSVLLRHVSSVLE
jgi:hypothetical protein